MLPGSFINGDVVQLTTYAVVNGVSREVESFNSDGALKGDLPDAVVASGGVSGRTGTIVWAKDQDVSATEDSPWHKPTHWPPSAGDRVQVYVSDGTTTFIRFTGVIDSTSGSVGGGMQSSVIDDRDKLNVRYTQGALLRHHVPYVENGDYRSIGMNYWFPLTMALRKAGLYNTPPPVADVMVSAPLQGSVWPEAGTVSEATGLVPGTHAAFYPSPWGYAAAGMRVTYLPRVDHTSSEALQMTMMLAPNHLGVFYMDVVFESGAIIRFRGSPDRAVRAYWNPGSGWVDVITPVSATSTATVVTLLVKGGTWTVKADNGAQATATQTISGGKVARVILSADEASRVAGVQVSSPVSTTHEFSSLSFTPSMKFTPGNLGSSMDMLPRLENRRVSELVDEICRSTLTAAWFDEAGVFNLSASDRLRSGSSVQTVTSLDDITGLDWEDSLLSVRSRVEVAWKDPSISKGKQQRKELFRGSGDSMVSSDTVEIVAEPDSNTEWLGVDRGIAVLDTSNWGVYNSRRGSYAGYFFSANGETTSEVGLTMSVTTENLGTAGVKISHTAGVYPGDVEANLATSPTSSALWPYLRNQNLPVIRGYGEGKWVDALAVSPTTGPSYAPVLNHELGYWGQEFFEGGSVASRLADFIAQMVTTPTPSVSGVEVTYDPRRQLGDVITLQLGILDVVIKGLVVSISENHSSGDHTQTLAIRIISVSSSRKVTYDELASAWQGGNYAGLQATWSGLNYNSLTSNPLQGAPN